MTTEDKSKIQKHKLVQEPAVNEQKVADVRAALQSGTYEVDPKKIAEKMLELESKLED